MVELKNKKKERNISLAIQNSKCEVQTENPSQVLPDARHAGHILTFLKMFKCKNVMFFRTQENNFLK